LLLFVANSLSVSSYTSALLSRDATVASQFAASAGANISNERSFDVERALSDLEQIAQTPHSLNDPRSIDVRDYLRTTIEGIIAGTSAQFSDPVVNGTVAEFKAKGWLVYWEDSSLVVRVPGTGSHAEALLVQAHYDAVPMSHGAYDDGVGVVVCVELLRNLIRYPVRYPVLINIDWGEENGLFGAMLFARFHPWAENVRAYINLEAGGVGGRAMVFRASHPTLLNAYKQAAQKPCASLVGNNAFKLGIVKSDTDYSIYTTSYGLPGLDLAFTDHRNLYHTARDHFREATAERTDNAIKDAVFYDVLSRFMVVRSYSAEMWLNICTGIAGIVIVIALQYPFARPLLASHVTPHASTLALDSSSPAERLVLQLGQDGLFSGLLEGLAHLVKGYMAGLFGSLVFTGLLISMVTPRLAYTHLALFVMLLFSAAALSSEALNGANGDEVSVGDQSNSNQHLVLADGHPLVVGVLFLLSSLRAFVGVFLPLLIGIDTMLRLLIVFKDHLPDGSPPVACTTIAALDIATFVLFLAPYIVSATNDIDQYWLVRWIGLAAAPFLRRLLPAWKQNMLANRHISATRPRSQISLHTNYARHRDSIDAESTRSSFEGGSNGGLTGHGANENEVDDVGERVIVLDSGRRSNPRSVGSNMHAAGGLAGGEESREEESSDEELGNRPVPARFSSTETREMVGRGMIYTWAGVWLALWVGAHTRDFYQCDMAYHYESRNGTWSPATAINITSVHHTSANVEHGTQFTVTLNFSAPETRTCFIDFGAHHGFSQQAYPNPRPVAPPITKYKRESAEPHLPAIDRVMLPVIDRARFVDGVTGAVAPIVEPVNERDAVFSGRIYAHKRSFDSNGQFSAVIQYSVPVANASKLRGALVDISCYFDVVDRHAPLLGSIIGAAPKWAIFTPASNTLSIVTVTGVEL
ncbi:hypothetical protein GGI02_000166, partial [Coemansia sp. RSA 2322]